MPKLVRPIAGILLLLFAAFWAVLTFISTVIGIATVPDNATPFQKEIISALHWLVSLGQVGAYGLAAIIIALAVGLLFWHPEKGWAFFFSGYFNNRKIQNNKGPENPRLDLIFGKKPNDVRPTLMVNIFSWYAQNHIINFETEDDGQKSLEHVYITIIFKEDVFPLLVTIDGVDLPIAEVKSKDQKHLFISVAGSLASKAVSIRVNDHLP